MLALFAQLVAQQREYFWRRSINTWDFGEFVIFLIVVCAIIGVAIVAMRYFDVWPPPWLVKILGIVLVAAVAIIAIRFLMGL